MPNLVRKNLSSIFLFFRTLCLFDFHLFTCDSLITMTDQTLESTGKVADSQKAKNYFCKEGRICRSRKTPTHEQVLLLGGREKFSFEVPEGL